MSREGGASINHEYLGRNIDFAKLDHPLSRMMTACGVGPL
jgi:hypothetical protein